MSTCDLGVTAAELRFRIRETNQLIRFYKKNGMYSLLARAEARRDDFVARLEAVSA